MKNWSIRTRVLFLALAPSVMILLALITYFTYTSIAEVDISLERHGISVARQLAPGTEFALFAGDRAALQRLTDAAVHESDVARVTITDAHGQALAQSGQDERLKIGESVLFTQAVTESRLPAADCRGSAPQSPRRPAAGGPPSFGQCSRDACRRWCR